MKRLLWLMLLIPSLAYGQFSPYSGQVITAQGALPRLGAFAIITVCQAGASGNPCFPKAIIYSNATGTGGARTNPFTADQNGNYTFWATAGTYLVSANFGNGNYAFYVSIGNTGGGGAGTVTSVSAGSIPTLFTTSVATPTTTPVITFTQPQIGAHLWYGNNTNVTTLPGLETIGYGDIPSTVGTTGVCPSGQGVTAINNNMTPTCAPFGAGTVTSIGMVVPAWLSVSPASITGSGTFAFTAATGQTSHQVLGTGAGASFGPLTLTTADLPFTYSGNTTLLGTVSGSLTNGHCLAAGASGNIVDSGVVGCTGAGGAGTVTSVGLGAPTGFTISGSPVTTTGTLSFAMPSSWATGALLLGNGATSVSTLPIGANNTCLTSNGTTASWQSCTNGGTVSSVGLSMPAIFNVSGTPITTSGTLTATLATQSANQIWSGPTTGAASAPTFRPLVKADQVSTTVYTDQANTWSAGVQDMSGALSFKVPIGAGLTTTVNGLIGYDSTGNVLHTSYATVDSKIPTFTVTPTIGQCASWTSMTQLGSTACGGGGGTPGGSSTQMQWNNAGSFAGTPNITYVATGGTLRIAPTSDSPTVDIIDVFNKTELTTPNKVWWIDPSGNVNQLGNTYNLGATLQTTQSHFSLYGAVSGASNVSPGYFQFFSGDGTKQTTLYGPGLSTSGDLCINSIIPTGDCKASVSGSNVLASFASSIAPTVGNVSSFSSQQPLQIQDSGIASANLVTASSNFTNAAMVIAAGANKATSSWVDFTVSSHTGVLGASGILDLSAANSNSSFLVPAQAGLIAGAEGAINEDTTTHAYHAHINNADAVLTGFATTIAGNKPVQTQGTGGVLVEMQTGTSDVTNRTSSQTSTTLISSIAANAKYTIKYYLDESTACTTVAAGGVTVTFNWTDGTRSRVFTTASLNADTSDISSDFISGALPIFAVSSTSITYTSTYTATCGTGGPFAYDIHVIATRDSVN